MNVRLHFDRVSQSIRRSARGGLARDTPNVGLRLHDPRRGNPRARACRAAAVRQPLSLIIYSIRLHFGLALLGFLVMSIGICFKSRESQDGSPFAPT